MSKRGENIRKRKDGRWEARYIEGYLENGKAKYRYLYAKTYAEVRLMKQRALGGNAEKAPKQLLCKTTLGEISHSWIINIKSHVKESTFARYSFIVEKYILPELGVKPVAWLTKETVERFTNDLLSKGKANGACGLAPKTVSDILCVLKHIITYSVECGCEIPSNFAIKQPKTNQPDIQILSVSIREKLENALIGSDDLTHLGILFALYTGVRIGELCALRWSDINLNEGTVTISHTICRIQADKDSPTKTKVIIGTPKTDCSDRVIPLPNFFSEYLKKYIGSNDTYILTGTENYTEPRAFYLRYKKVLDKYNIGKYTFHALRHTFATRCVENGFDTKSLSEILGHADVTITLKRYVHPSMEMKRTQMNKLNPPSVSGQK